MRSAGERQAFAAIAGYAAAKIHFMEERDSTLSDIRGRWSGEHVSPTAADDRALERQEHDYLFSPAVMRRFELESACRSELDDVLRGQNMKPLPKCLEYRLPH